MTDLTKILEAKDARIEEQKIVIRELVAALSDIVLEAMDLSPIDPVSSVSYLPYEFLFAANEAIKKALRLR